MCPPQILVEVDLIRSISLVLIVAPLKRLKSNIARGATPKLWSNDVTPVTAVLGGDLPSGRSGGSHRPGDSQSWYVPGPSIEAAGPHPAARRKAHTTRFVIVRSIFSVHRAL